MERERLARLKRASPHDMILAAEHAPRKLLKGSTSKAAVVTDYKISAPQVVDGTHRYWDGVVKKTFVMGQPRAENDITIEEVWQKVYNQCIFSLRMASDRRDRKR